VENEGLNPCAVDRFPVKLEGEPHNRAFHTEHGAALLAAIEELYDAFQMNCLGLPLRYCAHCFTEKDARYITSTPLRELPLEDIAFILPKAITTLGTAEDFNYFLPRVLEALAYQRHYEEHVIPDRLAHGRAAGWSDRQLAAVVTFFKVYVAAVNAMRWNTSAAYDFDHMASELKSVLPELPSDLVAVANYDDGEM